MLNLFSALLISAKEHKKNGVSQISGVSWRPSNGKEWFTRRNEREWRSHTLREKSAYLDDYVFDRIPESCDTLHFYLSRFKKTNNQPKEGKRQALTYWHTEVICPLSPPGCRGERQWAGSRLHGLALPGGCSVPLNGMLEPRERSVVGRRTEIGVVMVLLSSLWCGFWATEKPSLPVAGPLILQDARERADLCPHQIFRSMKNDFYQKEQEEKNHQYCF